ATVMHRDDRLGSITPGKLADLVIVDGDPTTNISDVRNVRTVVKDGNVFDAGEGAAAIGGRPLHDRESDVVQGVIPANDGDLPFLRVIADRWGQTPLQRVVFLQQHPRPTVAQVADLRLDVALERNLAMAGVDRGVDGDLLQLLAECLGRQMRSIDGQLFLIV